MDDLPPTGVGLDQTPGLRGGVSEEKTSGLSFLSLVYPRERWSIALYRHQAANYRFAGQTQGLFYGLRQCGNTPCPFRYLDQRWSLNEFEIVNHGLSGAIRISESLSLGLGIAYSAGSMDSISELYFVDEDSFEALIGRNHYLPWRQHSEERVRIDDSDWVFNLGVLWRFARQWSLGGVYRQGPKFDLTIDDFAGPAHPQAAAGDHLGSFTSPDNELPDVLGVGVAWRSVDGHWTVGCEWDRVGYSSLFSNPPASGSLFIEDADELHLGAEYVVPRSKPLFALRVGLWRDPDHRIQSSEDDPLIQALRRPGDDVTHFSFGLGIAFRDFQIDIGADLASTVDTVSISGIYSF